MAVAGPYFVDAQQTAGSPLTEDSAVTVYARITGAAVAAVQQADVSTITAKVFDLSSTTPTTAIGTDPVLVVASVISNTLQTGSTTRWTRDGTGYNFAHTVAGSYLATPDHRYRVEYVLTPTTGDVLRFAAEFVTLAWITS